MFLGIVDQASCIPVGSRDLLVFLNLIPQLVAQVALDLLQFRQFQDALQQEKDLFGPAVDSGQPGLESSEAGL